MITVELNAQTSDDVKCIEKLRSMGVPDDIIQRLYDSSLKAREQKEGEIRWKK